MASSDADMARMLQEQFDREQSEHQQGLQQQRHEQALTLAVTVPDGTRPGQMILVQTPSGNQVQIELPSYAVPGQTIQVRVPSHLQQGPESEPEGLDYPAPPPVPTPTADDDLARAIQASLAGASVPHEPSSVPPSADPFDVFAEPAPAQPQPQPQPQRFPPTTTNTSAGPSIGTAGVPLNNGAVDLQFYCVDTTTSSSTLYVFAISRVGVEQPSHTVSKSYADFVELNGALREELNASASANSFLIGAEELERALPPLPPKSTIGRRKAVVIAERQQALTQYLHAACAHPLLHDSLSLSLFLANPAGERSEGDAVPGGELMPPEAVGPGVQTRVPAAVLGDGGGGGNGAEHITTSVMVTVPQDGAPGQKLRVLGPSGHAIELVIPEGALPGQQLQVQADIPPPSQTQPQRGAVARQAVGPKLDGERATESGTWSVTARQPHVDASGHVVYPFAVTVTCMQKLPPSSTSLIAALNDEEGEDEDDQALLRSRDAMVGAPPPVPTASASTSPWNDVQSHPAPAAAPPVRRMAAPGQGVSPPELGVDPPGTDVSSLESVKVYELSLRYSEWAAFDSKLSEVRQDLDAKATLPELPNTSTVGRSKDRVMAERSKAVLEYLQALCSLPTVRNHPAFSALLETGRAAESSRQQLLGRLDALEMELAKRTMAMSAMEAENRRLSQALKEAESQLAQVRTTK